VDTASNRSNGIPAEESEECSNDIANMYNAGTVIFTPPYAEI